MMIPIRCFSCGKVIGDKYRRFLELVSNGMDPRDALDEIGLKRYCCRRMVLTHIDIIDKFLDYKGLHLGGG